MLTLAGQTTSTLELAAFVSGLLSVWLTWRMHIANWPVGIVSVLCFAALFLEARLYADALLQLVFVVLGVYGWWRWARAQAQQPQVPVSRVPPAEAAWGLLVSAAAIAATAAWLASQTDSPAPVPDAAVLVLSLLATWGQARGRIECWWAWIAVDLVSIPLYWSRSLPLTTLLYVLFLGLCVGGLRGWQHRLGVTGSTA